MDCHVKVKLEAVAHRVRRVVVVLATQLRALLDQRLHRGDVDRRVVARLTDVAKVATAAAAALEPAAAAAAAVVEARIVAIVVKAAAARLGLAALGALRLARKNVVVAGWAGPIAGLHVEAAAAAAARAVATAAAAAAAVAAAAAAAVVVVTVVVFPGAAAASRPL